MKKYCRNCYHPLPYKAKFCPNCAQKDSDGRTPIQDLFQQLWIRVFHLESRYIKGVFRILIPGRMSVDYFNGKHKRYPPPLQFFFISVTVFLLLLNQHCDDARGLRFSQTQDKNELNFGIRDQEEKSIDLAKIAEEYRLLRQIRRSHDSLPPELRTPETRAALDSVMVAVFGGQKSKLELELSGLRDSTDGKGLDSIPLNLFFTRNFAISLEDFATLDPDWIVDKYQINHWLDQLALHQSVKLIKDPAALQRSYLGTLGWSMFLLIIVMAGVLKLMYWRRRHYYVEHFIYLLHTHSSLLLFGALVMLIVLAGFPAPYAAAVSVLWGLYATFKSMRRYYRQSFGVSLAKWFLFSLLYWLFFIVFFSANVLVSFLIL